MCVYVCMTIHMYMHKFVYIVRLVNKVAYCRNIKAYLRYKCHLSYQC